MGRVEIREIYQAKVRILIVVGKVLDEQNPVYPAQSQNDKTGDSEKKMHVIERLAVREAGDLRQIRPIYVEFR